MILFLLPLPSYPVHCRKLFEVRQPINEIQFSLLSIKPSATPGDPWRKKRNPHHYDRQKPYRNGGRKRGLRPVSGCDRAFLSNSLFLYRIPPFFCRSRYSSSVRRSIPMASPISIAFCFGLNFFLDSWAPDHNRHFFSLSGFPESSRQTGIPPFPDHNGSHPVLLPSVPSRTGTKVFPVWLPMFPVFCSIPYPDGGFYAFRTGPQRFPESPPFVHP